MRGARDQLEEICFSEVLAVGHGFAVHAIGLRKCDEFAAVGFEAQERRRDDRLLSTLRRYVEALGGRLDLVADFGDRTVRLPVSDTTATAA